MLPYNVLPVVGVVDEGYGDVTEVTPKHGDTTPANQILQHTGNWLGLRFTIYLKKFKFRIFSQKIHTKKYSIYKKKKKKSSIKHEKIGNPSYPTCFFLK